MDYQVVWTESAQEDLKQIVNFIATDDPVAAERFGLGLVDHFEQASLQPWSGRKVPEANIEELRELIYSPYRIIYEIMDGQKLVYVIRVWHAARGEPKID
ncbi:type II toxin-antitoxin system RelE/ParE family toxin [Opitutia bacterium ISCC 51]|nr:type II toxin-antitoxin system RelE/ParE family toxin [Opitutae bacterium ISCC 51]QXD29098.1 type II toxin-antitoxin system RelE/ParE family toxin [Opitutae bacterium ISCC 52]